MARRINNLDELVLRYRESDCNRERNKLYKEIRQYFLHRVYSVMAKFHPRYHNDIMSTYDLFMVNCIEKWKNNGARFTTYAYPYSGIKLKSETIEKYVKKYNREKPCGQSEFFENYEKQHFAFCDAGEEEALDIDEL